MTVCTDKNEFFSLIHFSKMQNCIFVGGPRALEMFDFIIIHYKVSNIWITDKYGNDDIIVFSDSANTKTVKKMTRIGNILEKKYERIIPTSTANGEYSFDKVYFGKPLSKYIENAYTTNMKNRGCDIGSLKAGTFTFDSYAVAIGNALEYMQTTKLPLRSLQTTLCSIIHNGWVANYRYWKLNKPYIKQAYMMPVLPDYYENLSERRYFDLTKEEKYCNKVLLDSIFATMKK